MDEGLYEGNAFHFMLGTCCFLVVLFEYEPWASVPHLPQKHEQAEGKLQRQ